MYMCLWILLRRGVEDEEVLLLLLAPGVGDAIREVDDMLPTGGARVSQRMISTAAQSTRRVQSSSPAQNTPAV
jgi:hypothetical protein